MQTVKTILGFAVAAVFVAGAILLGGAGLSIFFDLPSLMHTLGIALCVTLGMHGPGSLRAALVAGLRGTAEPDLLATHAAVLGTLRHTLLASGAVGTLIGLVLMLSAMDEPTHLGPAMGVALLSLFYTVLLAELLLAPMASRLFSQAQDPAPPGEPGQTDGETEAGTPDGEDRKEA